MYQLLRRMRTGTAMGNPPASEKPMKVPLSQPQQQTSEKPEGKKEEPFEDHWD